MALDGAELAEKIRGAIASLNPVDNFDDIQSKYQSTIRDYLLDNIEITLHYEGIISGGGYDIEAAFKGKLSFPTGFEFLPAATKELFDLQLSTAVKGGLISNGDEDNEIEFLPLVFNPAALIVTVFPTFNPSEDSVEDFMESYCSSILDQIKLNFMSVTPSVGTRESRSSTGAVTMTGIS